jgi:hypothetical protein
MLSPLCWPWAGRSGGASSPRSGNRPSSPPAIGQAGRMVRVPAAPSRADRRPSAMRVAIAHSPHSLPQPSQPLLPSQPLPPPCKCESHLGTWYTAAQGMSRAKRDFRWGRGLVAACLTLLFSFSSLAPIAAQSFNGACADMPCCKSKGKCCCRKRLRANPNRGPVIGSAGCVECGGGTIGSVSAMGHAAIRLQLSTPTIRATGGAAVSTVLTPSRISEHSLRQRPPPQSPLA